uniref:Uncharacterized protein n=1 Tax=Arundo donax TaxID=35708 RepID=A0A0A9FLG5_ARUDO
MNQVNHISWVSCEPDAHYSPAVTT